jgi:hypothetical protein
MIENEDILLLETYLAEHKLQKGDLLQVSTEHVTRAGYFLGTTETAYTLKRREIGGLKQCPGGLSLLIAARQRNLDKHTKDPLAGNIPHITGLSLETWSKLENVLVRDIIKLNKLVPVQ